MEPNVVVVLIGVAAILALLARGRHPAPQSEPVPVRVDDDPPRRRR
jgi:hypothetical protein